ncbi:MAG TPA: hypothetical protein VGC41_27590 [Kofleriaceae bacterium]
MTDEIDKQIGDVFHALRLAEMREARTAEKAKKARAEAARARVRAAAAREALAIAKEALVAAQENEARIAARIAGGEK